MSVLLWRITKNIGVKKSDELILSFIRGYFREEMEPEAGTVNGESNREQQTGPTGFPDAIDMDTGKTRKPTWMKGALYECDKW